MAPAALNAHQPLRAVAFTLALFLACAPAVRLGQSCAPPSDTESVRRAIQAIEERIGSANFDCDYKYFAEIEAPEFIYTDPRGGVTTRAEDLAGEPNCHKEKGSYTLDQVRLQVHGDVAVYNARATTTVLRDGAPLPPRVQRFTDVLVWRDCQWKLVSGHSSRIS